MQYINSRLEKILLAFIHNNIPLTSEQLSVTANVSTRTIKKDIVELNEYLKSFNIEILSKPGVGYSININNDFLYNQLLLEMKRRDIQTAQMIPKYRYERVNYIIKKLLTVDYYITLEDLIDEMYISRSTLTADFKEVREIFKDYNLELVSKPNYGIILVGDEISMRLCISEYFFHTDISTGYFAADNAMFVSNTNQNEITFVKQLLVEITEKYNIHMSDLSIQNFVVHILIAIRRWKFYNYVKIDQKTLDEQRNLKSKEFAAAKELKSSIEEKMEILLPDDEVIYFSMHLKSKHINELDEIDKEEIELVEKTFYDTYRLLQKKFDYFAINKAHYEEYLRLHIPAMVDRLKTGLVMRNPTLYDILSKYLLATHITILIASIIEENFACRMNRNEFGYLVLYTNLLFGAQTQAKNNKILLVCGRGRPETITLLNEINEDSSKLSEIVEICDVYTLETKDVNQFSMVLSTVPLKTTYKIPLVYINGEQSYFHQIQQAIKENRVSCYKVEKYFKESYFNPSLKGSIRDEVFTEVAREIGNKDLLNLFWDAEHVISHETPKGIVFLHTLKTLEEDFIYVGILKKAIIWNKHWAQIVIFVNLNQDITQLQICYDFLSELMIDSDAVTALSKVNSFSEFIEFARRCKEKQR